MIGRWCRRMDNCSPLAELLEGPIPTRVAKILEVAEANGWVHNFTSLVTRWYPNGEDKYGLPWYGSWHLNYSPDKSKWSWRWAGGMAKNCQRLNHNDTLIYLQNPEVIYPEPPKETQADKVNKMLGGKSGRSNE